MFGPDLVGSLWNVELLYDFALLLAHPAYQDFPLAEPGLFFAEGWQRVEQDHRLQVVSVEHNSPLLFLALIPLAFAGAGGVWAVTQTVDKIANFRLNRRKLKADVVKSEADARKANAEADAAEFDLQVRRRNAEATAEQLGRQVRDSPMQIVEGEVTSERSAA